MPPAPQERLEFVRLIGQNFLAVCSNERQATEQEMDGVAKHHTGDN
jgi:hypothetical protein